MLALESKHGGPRPNSGRKSTGGKRNEQGLNPLEQIIIQHTAEGLSIKVMADRIGLSFSSLETMRVRLFKRFKVTNSAQLVSVCYQKGILKVDSRGTD